MRHGIAARGANWLCLAAAPTFAAMALLTAGAGPPDAFCAAAQHVSPLSGMAAMYGLMSAFHSAPWLKLISNRCSALRSRSLDAACATGPLTKK